MAKGTGVKTILHRHGEGRGLTLYSLHDDICVVDREHYCHVSNDLCYLDEEKAVCVSHSQGHMAGGG